MKRNGNFHSISFDKKNICFSILCLFVVFHTYFFSLSSFTFISYSNFSIVEDVEARWPTHQQEVQDEMNDMQILNAVQQSMKDYEKLHKHHRHKRAEKSVCYGDELGCFEDSGPFGYLDMLPQSPEEIGTKFHFYSTENRSDVPLLDIPYLNMSRMFYELNRNESANETFPTDNNSTILTPEIQKNILKLKSFEGFDRLSIRVIVHGFGSACHHVWIYEMRTALMAVVSFIE